MLDDHDKRRLSHIVLCASLVLVAVVAGVRATYVPSVSHAIAFIELSTICLAAWRVGAWAIRAEAQELRTIAVAGGLLITPWSLFSLMPGIGAPHQATHAENEVRYVILLINAIAIAGGLVALREAIGAAGERFHSTLGVAAIVCATPLYLVWAAIVLAAHRAMQNVSSDAVPAWISSVHDVSNILLYFGGALTYVATAAFATSLGRARWIGRGATRAFVIASFLALSSLVIRGLDFPDPTSSSVHWYQFPGIVVGIPAVPWIMPCVLGVVLLRRAGDARR